jgi:ferredoxin
MTYLVTENCVKCKHMTCVEVCPVDCFYEGENMLVINPLECIDCGVCEPECPADAIVPDNALSPEKAAFWETVNQRYADQWPNITEVRPEDVPKDAEQWNGVPDKYEKYFSEKPGRGD